MPDNYIYLGLLAAMFPNAAFIHCRRDLRDVALSCWITDFRPENIPWASDATFIGSRFEQYLRLMAYWRAVMPVPIHEVKYEDTVVDLEGVAKRLVGACGVDFEPRCLDFHRTERRVKTASVGQVRQPIYSRSVGRWKNYESDLAFLFRALPDAGSDSNAPANGGAYPQVLNPRSTGELPGPSCDSIRSSHRPGGHWNESSQTLASQEA